MSQSFAVWFVIGLALLTANLPFLSERPFVVLPWVQTGESPAPAWLRWPGSLLFFCALVGVAWLGYWLIGGAILLAGDTTSALLFTLRLIGALVLAGLVLTYPGWRSRNARVEKSFLVRLIELLVFYGLVGVLGFAFELNLGNVFAQTWQFYAITLCLFVVLGYPGFVLKYLLRRRKHGKAR